VNRRDFFLFRTTAGKRVVELSCERLYMRCVDAESARGARVEPIRDTWEGEPPRFVHEPTIDELFSSLDADLRKADILRLVDTRWMASEELKQRLGDLVAAFLARGGVVET
jgi:hypothetical protein